jgi:uncharacterized protein (TIGR01244 family)
LVTVALSACSSSEPAAPGELEARELGSIPNLHAYGDVLLAGQPSAADLELVAAEGVRTVVNMRKQEELELDEGPLVERLGMAYVHAPWNGPDELTDEVFDTYRALLEDAERPLLLHCKSANRVGAVWLAWRVLDGGLGVDEARAEAREVGLKSPQYEARALEYVERVGSLNSGG